MIEGWHIQEQAFRAFDVWLSSQPEDVQDLDILDQVELYAAATQVGAK